MSRFLVTIFVALFFLALIPVTVHAATLIKPTNNLGLVGYWSFDEGSGTKASDLSGNGNTGTLTTMDASTDWVYGKRGKALDFDGTDDYVNVGSVGTIQTISFWIQADDITSRNVINIDGTDQIEINGSSEIVATSFPSATVYIDGSSSSQTITSGWHHITIIDGAGVSASSFEIGRGTTSYFDGKIDEVRIYNRTLSASEVSHLASMGAVKLGTTPRLNHIPGLVGWWTMDGKDLSGSTAYDRSGQGDNGTVTAAGSGGTLTNDLIAFWELEESSGTRVDAHGSNDLTDVNTVMSTTGKVGDAALFVAANSERLEIVDNADLSLGSDTSFTLAMWINPTLITAGDHYLFNKGDGDPTTPYRAAFDNGTLFFRVGNGVSFNRFNYTGSFTTGSWYFIIFSYDSSSQLLRMRVNDGTAQTKAHTLGTSDDTGSFALGSRFGSRNYDGVLDSVAFWKGRALSSTEESELYNSGSGVSYSTLSASSGSSTPRPVVGKIGQALSFDGSTQHIEVGTAYNGVKSISFWMKPNSTTESILDLNGTASVSVSGGTINATGFTSPTIYVDGAVSSTVSDTEWHLITITTATGINASALKIGKIASDYYSGSLDDVRLYSGVLTGGEVSSIYNSTRPSTIQGATVVP